MVRAACAVCAVCAWLPSPWPVTKAIASNHRVKLVPHPPSDLPTHPQAIDAVQQHIRNLLTPSTPYFFNTLYDPYTHGADFVVRLGGGRRFVHTEA